MRPNPIDSAQSPGPERPPNAVVDRSSRPAAVAAPLLTTGFESRLDALERRTRLAFAREEETTARYCGDCQAKVEPLR